MYAQEIAKQIVDALKREGFITVSREILLLQPDLMGSIKAELGGMAVSSEASFVDQSITYRLEGHERTGKS